MWIPTHIINSSLVELHVLGGCWQCLYVNWGRSSGSVGGCWQWGRSNYSETMRRTQNFTFWSDTHTECEISELVDGHETLFGQKMNPTDFDEPLTLITAPSLGDNFIFSEISWKLLAGWKIWLIHAWCPEDEPFWLWLSPYFYSVFISFSGKSL